jgi:hypothetical protein
MSIGCGQEGKGEEGEGEDEPGTSHATCRYVDDEVDMVQSNAILRHIGRKYGLMGSTEKEHSVIDMAMEGVESLRMKYLGLIYQAQMSEVRVCWIG